MACSSRTRGDVVRVRLASLGRRGYCRVVLGGRDDLRRSYTTWPLMRCVDVFGWSHPIQRERACQNKARGRRVTCVVPGSKNNALRTTGDKPVTLATKSLISEMQQLSTATTDFGVKLSLLFLLISVMIDGTKGQAGSSLEEILSTPPRSLLPSCLIFE